VLKINSKVFWKVKGVLVCLFVNETLSNLIIKKIKYPTTRRRGGTTRVDQHPTKEVTPKGITTPTRVPKEGSGDSPKGFQIPT
jgi:hypothetical protein